jgi:hypothetical protein
MKQSGDFHDFRGWEDVNVFARKTVIQPYGLMGVREILSAPNRCASLGVIDIQTFGLPVHQGLSD